MAKKIFILAIPGIGTQAKGFSTELANDLKRYTQNTSLEGNYSLIECMPFSATNIDKNQQALYDRLKAANKLEGMFSFRHIVMEAFGDGVTFERGAQEPNSPYRKIHQYLKENIEKVTDEMATCENSKLVIVAASMGVHLLSTYIWDATEHKGIFEHEHATSRNNLKNLSFLASIGCNIPLFVSGLEESQIIAFKKPNPEFTWDNYYDKDDVLGWPIKQLSPSYSKLVTDYEINTGIYVDSHIKYWGDDDFTKPFTQKLVRLYEQM